VHLFNIDDIRNKASEALEERKAAIPAVKQLIGEALAEFQFVDERNDCFSGDSGVQATLDSNQAAGNQPLPEEPDRRGKPEGAGYHQKHHPKILKLPVLQLKAACQRGEAEQLSDVLRTLFNLEVRKEGAEA